MDEIWNRRGLSCETLTRRVDDTEAAIEAINGDYRQDIEVYLGAIYNGGAMPTTTPGVFLTRPLTATANEVEGAAVTRTTGTASIPVVILNSVPVGGESVIAVRRHGRWIGEIDKFSSSGGTITLFGCSCAVPLTFYMHCAHPQPVTVTPLGSVYTFAAACQFAYFHAGDLLPDGLCLANRDGFFSTTWVDTPDGPFWTGSGIYRNWYIFQCYLGAYTIGNSYYHIAGGVVDAGGFILTYPSWLPGLSGNTCSPFSLTNATGSNLPGFWIDAVGPA